MYYYRLIAILNELEDINNLIQESRIDPAHLAGLKSNISHKGVRDIADQLLNDAYASVETLIDTLYQQPETENDE